MTEWEGSYPKKTPDQDKKDRVQEIKWMLGLIVRIPLIIIMFVGFANLFFNSYDVSKYFSNMLRVLKRNETFEFTKTTINVPNQKIVIPYGWTEQQNGFNTLVTYDENRIYFYESLRLKKPIETIKIDGEIKSVSCYYREPKFSLGFPSGNGDGGESENQQELNDGLLIHCQYSKNNTDRLVVFRIPARVYTLYNLAKNPELKNIFDPSDFLINQNEAKSTLPRNVTEDRKILHPIKALVKDLDLPFEKREFICFTGNYGYIIENTKDYSLEYFDDNGVIINRVIIGKPFIYDFRYMFESVEIYTFDGIYCNQHNFDDNGKLHKEYSVEIKEVSEIAKSRFVPGNMECFGSYDPLLVSGNKAFSISFNDYSIIRGALGNLDEIEMLDHNTFKMDGQNYHFNVRRKEKQKISIQPISNFSLFWDPTMPEKMYTNDVIIAGMFISPSIDIESQKPVVYIDYADNLMIADTSGIDESVDRAYVTYEEGNMAIYFMNDRSIFRWSCTREEYRQMKFMNITDEPEGLLLERN